MKQKKVWQVQSGYSKKNHVQGIWTKHRNPINFNDKNYLKLMSSLMWSNNDNLDVVVVDDDDDDDDDDNNNNNNNNNNNSDNLDDALI